MTLREGCLPAVTHYLMKQSEAHWTGEKNTRNKQTLLSFQLQFTVHYGEKSIVYN